jgi:ribonuclease-3
MTQLSFDLENYINELRGANFTELDIKSFFTHKKNFTNWINEAKISELWLSHQDTFIESITHSSLSQQYKKWPFGNNQRLEFLGDAALDFFISKILLDRYPNEPEGNLSKLRSTLVNEESLSQWARVIKLDQFIILGNGERIKSPLGDGIISDAFEALIGAMSIKLSNWEEILYFWFDVYEKQSEDGLLSLDRLEEFDPKTSLQEKTLALYKKLPEYLAKDIDDGREFKVTLTLGGLELASAQSFSKKKAQREVAKIVLKEKKYLGLSI